MRVALYVRVSTTAQTQAQTIEQQLDRLREHVAAQGWSAAAAHIFRDDGYSGATLRRPGLDRLRDVARERAIDLVLVTTPDRLARKYVHQALLVEEFERCGCPVTFLDRPMSQDPHDQLLLQIRGAVAEYERSLIAERMRRGRLAKLRAGVLLPWTKPPYGYRLHPERPRDPAGVRLDPVAAAVVAEIFAAYLQPGASLASVIRTLHGRQVRSPSGQEWWGLASVRGVLTNPAYTGQVYAGRMRRRPPRLRRSATHPIGRPHASTSPIPCAEWIPVATIPAVVSTEQFALVRENLAHNQAFARRRNTAHCSLLRALVSCGRCQSACTAQTSASGHAYYVCSGKHQAQRTHRESRCPARFIPARQLEALVWADLCAVVSDPASISQALERAQGGQWLPQAVQARQANLRKGRTSLAQQVERLTEAYLHGVIPLAEYERRRSDLEQQDQSLALQEEHLAAEAARQHEIAGLVTHIEAFCQRVQAGLASATFEQQRQLVELLIDRVVVTDDHVDIRYAIPTSPDGERLRFCYLRTDYFHVPSAAGFAPPLGAQAVGQHRSEAGFPLAHGLVGEGDAAFEEHLGQVAEAQFVLQAPAHDRQHHIGGILEEIERGPGPFVAGPLAPATAVGAIPQGRAVGQGIEIRRCAVRTGHRVPPNVVDQPKDTGEEDPTTNHCSES